VRRLRGDRSAHQIAVRTDVPADAIRQYEIGRGMSIERVVAVLRYLRPDAGRIEQGLDNAIQSQMSRRDPVERIAFKEQFLTQLEEAPSMVAAPSRSRRGTADLDELAGNPEGDISEPDAKIGRKARPASSGDRATALWRWLHSGLRTEKLASARIFPLAA
jgi:hypothetical protein